MVDLVDAVETSAEATARLCHVHKNNEILINYTLLGEKKLSGHMALNFQSSDIGPIKQA